jgi:hypothetical protein
VFSNFPIPADAPAIRSLHSLQDDVAANLGVTFQGGDSPVEVYILNDRQSFAHFLKFYYPELPPRRAFFLAQGTQRVVFTFQGERLEEDLRHEATHALLNVVYGDLPLWLDEGLAEYFEGPGSRAGINPEHLGRLPQDLAAGWTPDLAHLESLKSVREMTPRDYRESWAWVHYLLTNSDTGKATLLGYLNELHENPKAVPLSSRLSDGGRELPHSLVAHLDRVRARPATAAGKDADPTIRLQDRGLENTAATATRPSFFARLRAFFGL